MRLPCGAKSRPDSVANLHEVNREDVPLACAGFRDLDLRIATEVYLVFDLAQVVAKVHFGTAVA